jgi:hypothetical protein
MLHVFAYDICINHTYLSDGFWIKRPVEWTWLNSILIIGSTITGLYFSMLRLFLLMLFAFSSIFSLDYSLFPERFKCLDYGYCSFLSVAGLALRHGSPPLQTMARIYKAEHKVEHTEQANLPSDATAQANRLASTGLAGGGTPSSTANKLSRNRWHLAVTLLNNPSIIPLRKARCAAAKAKGAKSAKGEGQLGWFSDMLAEI